MATRDGQPLNLVWVLVNLRASQIDAFFATVAVLHGNRLPTAILSVNRSVGWNSTPPTGLRQALVKIATMEADLLTALTPGAANAVIRVFTEADHSEARALVSSVEWTGPQGGA